MELLLALWLTLQLPTPPQPPTPPTTPTTPTPPAAKRKLSFKEQKELDGMPAKIEATETRQRELEAAIAAPEFYRGGAKLIQDTLAELETVKAELDVLLHRWTELEEKH